jgi:predicted RNA-binding protein YlqC (UPF0109 family)
VKELVRLVVERLVSHPEAVEVIETERGSAAVIEVRVAKEDLGRVIGKQGKTIGSLRQIITAIGSRTNQKTVVEIVE